MLLNNATVLITGGTGSFGKRFVADVFQRFEPKKVIVYSRDEYKQYVMRQSFLAQREKLRFFIGDVRDKERMRRAFDGVDYVVHAAALKQVPACEYNPFEAVKTNVHGAENVVDNAIDCSVKKVVALSTDKAVNPINLYGATKLTSDKLFLGGNAYSGAHDTTFSIVRYGNVAGSRGSVIPFFRSLMEKGVTDLPITDFRMTRFWITLDQAVDLVFRAFEESKGGETYVTKIPSFKVTELARAMSPKGTMKEVGIREGEKLHEVMITESDSFNTYKYDDHFIIYPSTFDWWTAKRMKIGGVKVEEFFRYASDTNTEWLSAEQIQKRIAKLDFVE
jgi:UDP-N-acetylglucosamine 4,6-dehydratase/5-epimerase